MTLPGLGLVTLLVASATPTDSPPAAAQSTPPAVTTAGDDLRLTARPGDGVKVVVGDEDFTFQIRGRAQVRAEGSAEEGAGGVGFQVRRLRLTMSGDALQKQFAYNVQLAFAPRDLEADNPIIVRDAWVAWQPARALRLRLGQMKVPFDRQRVTSSANLQFPERSDVINELTLDRDVGVVAFSAPLADAFSYQLGVFGGEGRARLNEDLGLLFTARGQWTPLGAFDDDHVEGDPERNPRARMAVAAAAGFNAASPRPRSTTGAFLPDQRVDYAHGTVDAVFKRAGFSVLVAGLARVATGTPVGAPTARSVVGGLAQIGLMVTDHVEIVGRAGHLEPVVGAVANDPGLVRSDELRTGTNVYVLGHDLKVSVDLGVTLPAGAPTAVDGHVMAQFAY